MFSKNENIQKLRREAAQVKVVILKDLMLSRQDLVLYSKPIPDQHKFSKINLDLMKNSLENNAVYEKYYSSIANSTKGMRINDLIKFPESEVRVKAEEKEIIQHNLNKDEEIKKVKKRNKISTSKTSVKIAFSNIYNNNKYKYIVTSGNNSKLIREAMSKRNWWVEIPNVDSVFNFKWQPVSYRMKFRELGKKTPYKQIVNHFEFHKCLSEKNELYSCLQSH